MALGQKEEQAPVLYGSTAELYCVWNPSIFDRGVWFQKGRWVRSKADRRKPKCNNIIFFSVKAVGGRRLKLLHALSMDSLRFDFQPFDFREIKTPSGARRPNPKFENANSRQGLRIFAT